MGDTSAISSADVAAYPIELEPVIIGTVAEDCPSGRRWRGRVQFVAIGSVSCDRVVMHVNIVVEEKWYLDRGRGKNGRSNGARTATTSEGNRGHGGIQTAWIGNRDRTDSSSDETCCRAGARARSTDETDGRGRCIPNARLHKRDGGNRARRIHRANHGTRARATTAGKHHSIRHEISATSRYDCNGSDYARYSRYCRSLRTDQGASCYGC